MKYKEYNITKIFVFLPILILISLFLDQYISSGNIITGDTVYYLESANTWVKGIRPHSELYLVGYPWIIAMFAKYLKIKIINSVFFFQLALFTVNVIIIINWLIGLSKENKNRSYGLILVLSVFFGWWSFRIQRGAHADSLFYMLFVVYLYLVYLITTTKNKYFYFLLAIVLYCIVQVKYNAYLLLPFTTFCFYVINKNKILNFFKNEKDSYKDKKSNFEIK